MDKHEAAEELGISVRTLMRMVSDKEISTVKKRGARNAMTLDFDPAEIARVKAERNQETHSGALVKTTPQLPAQQIFDSPAMFELVGKAIDFMERQSMTNQQATDRADASQLKDRLVLTVNEAAIYSGLGKGFILSAIESGDLNIIKSGGHRAANVVKRADLEKFVENLGKGRKR